MQYTGMTEMFSFIGEMMSMGFKPAAKKFEHAAHHKGDKIVNFWTKSNRPLKLLGFMTGSFVVVAGGIVINRKIQNNEIIPATSPTTVYFNNQYNRDILPRLQQAMDTALKYAQNGNISLLDPHLDTIAEIVIEYPQFKGFVKYTKPMEFPKNTYFDPQNGGLPDIESKINDHYIKQQKKEHKPSESIILQSQSSDTASMILSMDKEELKEEMLKNMENIQESKDMIKFENQLDYIRHVCVIRRCEKIYFRALRHAKKGNVQQCAQIMAELWEYTQFYEMPIIMEDEKGDRYKLEENDLMFVMKICHRNYAKYLIDSAMNIGDKVDMKGLNKAMIGDMNKKLLNMVWKNLENARIYAEKYNVMGDEIKNKLKTVWQEKEKQFQIT